MSDFLTRNNTKENIEWLFYKDKYSMAIINLFNNFFSDNGMGECHVYQMKDFNKVKFSSDAEMHSLTKELNLNDPFYIIKQFGDYASFVGPIQLYKQYLSYYQDDLIDWLNEEERDLFLEC